jgi:hypothetical protein
VTIGHSRSLRTRQPRGTASQQIILETIGWFIGRGREDIDVWHQDKSLARLKALKNPQKRGYEFETYVSILFAKEHFKVTMNAGTADPPSWTTDQSTRVLMTSEGGLAEGTVGPHLRQLRRTPEASPNRPRRFDDRLATGPPSAGHQPGFDVVIRKSEEPERVHSTQRFRGFHPWSQSSLGVVSGSVRQMVPQLSQLPG